jgi:hypothetical protein
MVSSRPACAATSCRNTPRHAARRSLEIGADAEGAELVVAELADAFAVAAAQHVDQVAGAEALAGAVDAGLSALRAASVASQVCGRVAGSCRSCRRASDVLAEVGEQVLAAAAAGSQ